MPNVAAVAAVKLSAIFPTLAPRLKPVLNTLCGVEAREDSSRLRDVTEAFLRLNTEDITTIHGPGAHGIEVLLTMPCQGKVADCKPQERAAAARQTKYPFLASATPCKTQGIAIQPNFYSAKALNSVS